MTYRISADAYLARARKRLMENQPEALFYAAYELRCGIEARQAEHVEAVEFKMPKIKPWEISDTRRKYHGVVGRAIEAGPITELGLRADGKTEFLLYYTPLTAQVLNSAERTLHGLLHVQQRFYKDDDVFWAEKRQQLVEIYRTLWISCRGTLMAPPILSPETGQMHGMRVEDPSPELQEWIAEVHRANRDIEVSIAYLTEPPADWVADL